MRKSSLALLDAAERGDIGAIRSAIVDGAAIRQDFGMLRSEINCGRNAVLLAAGNGHLEAMRYLIDCGGFSNFETLWAAFIGYNDLGVPLDRALEVATYIIVGWFFS